MKLYVAGPMTHIPHYNFPAFDAMADRLREYGYEVVSPAELDSPEDRAAAMASIDGNILDYGNGIKKTWGQFLARDVALIADSGIEGIVVLTGWQYSRGARLETFVGSAMCGLPIYYPYGSNPTWDLLGRERIDLTPVPLLTLYRAWTAEPDLNIHHSFGKRPEFSEEYA